MLHADTIKALAGVLKLDVSKLEAAIKSDKEETLEVPVLFDEPSKEAFGKNRFEEGKKAASEILVKDLKVKHNLEFEGKSVDKLIEALSEKAITDAKIEPNEKVKKIEAEKKELQSKLALSIENEQKLSKEYNDKLFHVETKTSILSQIPDNTIIPKEDLVELFMNRHRVAKEDDRVIIYKGTEKLVDNVLNPIPLKSAVAQFAESYLKKDGMGGSDNGGGGATGKFKTMSQFIEHCKKNGIEPMSDEGSKLLNENKEATFDKNS